MAGVSIMPMIRQKIRKCGAGTRDNFGAGKWKAGESWPSPMESFTRGSLEMARFLEGGRESTLRVE